jgi:hypothetical protein
LLRIRSFQLPIIFTLLCLTFLTNGHAQQWSGVVSSSRATDWTQAGIPGGIPSVSWSQCGSTIAPYSGSSSTILNALNSCSGKSQYVLLGAGDFYLSGAIYGHGLSNVELRGSGPTQTRLHFSGGSTCQNGNGSCLIGFATTDGNYTGSPGNVVNWTGGYAQGSNTITLSSGAGITANSTLLVLDQCDTGFSGSPCSGSAVDNGNYFNCEAYWTSTGVGCSYTGPVGAERTFRGQEEIVEATSCSPACGSSGQTTVTIKPALHHPNWAASQTPQVWMIQPSRYVGVRNLRIDGSSMSYSSVTTGIGFAGVSYYWVQNVALDSLPNISIFVSQGASHGVIESNYIYNSGQSNPATDTSGINVLGSNNLIDNNICHNCHLAYVGNGPMVGNVISYNFMVNNNTGNSTLYEGFDDGHSNGIDYNLYEGNATTSVAMDQAHGTHLVNTFYRNFFYAWESCANGNCGTNNSKTDNMFALMPVSNHRYGNYVGNVLGTPGVTTASCGGVYQYTNAEWYKGGPGDCGNVWNIGSGNTVSPPSYAGPIPIDPVVAQTILRWGNYDTINGSIQWNTSEVPSSPPGNVLSNPVPTGCTSSGSCPASFYLPGRPSWWPSSIAFPAIGPDVSGGNVGQCTGNLNTPGQYGGVAATSSSQCKGTSLASAWAGHVNAIPAMACFLSTLNGPPDGTGGMLAYDANACYAASKPGTIPAAPTNLTGTFVE